MTEPTVATTETTPISYDPTLLALNEDVLSNACPLTQDHFVPEGADHSSWICRIYEPTRSFFDYSATFLRTPSGDLTVSMQTIDGIDRPTKPTIDHESITVQDDASSHVVDAWKVSRFTEEGSTDIKSLWYFMSVADPATNACREGLVAHIAWDYSNFGNWNIENVSSQLHPEWAFSALATCERVD
ncbi:MAG: hypothetical protein ABII18_12065 [bacterium]|nr:hypothetical protein [bacterium]MBU1917432.1 hypothetical protein [bacterium]